MSIACIVTSFPLLCNCFQSWLVFAAFYCRDRPPFPPPRRLLFSSMRCTKTSFGDSLISSGFTPSLIHVSTRICFRFVMLLTCWFFLQNRLILSANALPTHSTAEYLVVEAQTLSLAVHKLLSISKELHHSVGIETCNCFHWQTEVHVQYWSAGDGSGFRIAL